MVTGLFDKFKPRGSTTSDVDKISSGRVSRKARANKSLDTSGLSRPALKTLSKANIRFQGNPEDRVIIFDVDETLVAGDKMSPKKLKKLSKQINSMGDRKLVTIKADDPRNTLKEDISYVLRPGVKEVLQDLTSKGYIIIASTRNYREYGKTIVNSDPSIKPYITATLGREDLESDLNKDFTKFPDHPDNLGLITKIKATAHKVFVASPSFAFSKVKSFFTGENVRWSPGQGELGKHPPAMIDLAIAQDPSKAAVLKGLKPSRILVDNKAERETTDSLKSGTWVEISPNVVREEGDEVTEFTPTSVEPKTADGEYVWVKQVKDGIERGWKKQLELLKQAKDADEVARQDELKLAA
jgi:hypothetical protein